MTETIPTSAHLKHLDRAARLAPVLCALCLGACAADTERSLYDVDEALFADLGERGVVELDLRDVDSVFVVDQAAVDASRVQLTCPNGAAMRLDSWLLEQGPELTQAETVVLAASPWDGDALFERTHPDCRHSCRACPDGVTVCHSECGSPTLREVGETQDPLEGHEGGEPPPPPQDRPSGSEGGSSGGAGSGGSPGGHPGR